MPRLSTKRISAGENIRAQSRGGASLGGGSGGAKTGLPPNATHRVKIKTHKQLTEYFRKLQKMPREDGVFVGFNSGNWHPFHQKYTAQIAYDNEMGDGRVPPRPFMTKSAINITRERDFKSLMINGFDAQNARMNPALIRTMGTLLKATMRQTIVRLLHPRNAPDTVLKKGFDNPLIETGYMRDHIDVWRRVKAQIGA